MERLPGFRDFYPEPLPTKECASIDLRQHIFNTWREAARRYGFREYDGPPLETLELYTTKSGDEIVKQLYDFMDKGDRHVAMRPEMTPTLARMVGAYERAYKKPIKWFSIPQLFRYERQQKGRLREHFQFNADIIGESSPALESELIALLIDSLRMLGLTSEDFVIRLSSRKAWENFFNARCPDPAKAYEFYQIVDKMEREEPTATQDRLSKLGFAHSEVEEFIEGGVPTEELQVILENLSARGLRDYVKVDYKVIRGLAYYTGVVFEAFDKKGEFRAIAGGGRYDNLVKLISDGKVDLPALGFGMGDVVLGELLKARGLWKLPEFGVDVFCIIEDEEARPAVLRVCQILREAGVSVEYATAPMKADKQFKRAVELKAKHAITRQPGGIKIKNLQSREEMVIAEMELATWAKQV